MIGAADCIGKRITQESGLYFWRRSPAAHKCPEDAIEDALFNPEPVFQSLNPLPMGMRIFQVHVERWRIVGADPTRPLSWLQSSTQPFEVRVENPHVCLTPKGSGQSQLSPEAILLRGGVDKGMAREEGECD